MQDSFKAILPIPLQSERVKGLLEYRPVLFVVDVEPANPNFISKYRNKVGWLAHITGTTCQQCGQFFTNLDSKEEIADFLKAKMIISGVLLRDSQGTPREINSNINHNKVIIKSKI